MKIRNPYRQLPRWFRGNTHTHSTRSDGEWPVERMIDFYRDRGYAFLAMTDHDAFTDLSRFSTPTFLGLSSDEVTVRGRDHIVGLHLEGPVNPFQDHQRTIAGIADQGGLAVIAHPNWSALSPARCLALHSYHAIEILNVVCNYLEYNGYALQYWDRLLTRGVRVWGIAADDAHRVACQGAKAWVVVNAERLTVEEIVGNLQAGNFYSSTGPDFRSLEVADGRIRIACSPVVEIRFVTGGRIASVICGEELTAAEYAPRPADSYVRVELVDAAMQSAWSQPFFIDPDWRP